MKNFNLAVMLFADLNWAILFVFDFAKDMSINVEREMLLTIDAHLHHVCGMQIHAQAVCSLGVAVSVTFFIFYMVTMSGYFGTKTYLDVKINSESMHHFRYGKRISRNLVVENAIWSK